MSRHARVTTGLLLAMLAACGESVPERTSRADSPAPAMAATHDSATRATAAGTDSAVVGAAADTAWIAHPSSIGALRVGMSRASLIGVIGQPSRVGYATHESCKYTRGSRLPKGIQVMTFDSVVVRIDVTEPGVRTAEGVQVGDRETRVLERYGDRAEVTSHKYSGPQWHYVTVTPANDPAHRIVFETDGNVVKNYRVGRVPEVEWVEGCS